MKFSIIVPIYKVPEKYLYICIDSILKQSESDFELILINDGSPDNCPSICDSYASKDKRVIVIHQQNKGLVASREVGLNTAKGDYICYVDGDDWVDQEWLKRVREVIDNWNPDIICFNSFMTYKKGEKEVINNFKKGYYSDYNLEKIYKKMLFDPDMPFYTFGIYPSVWSKVYKKELIFKCRCTDYSITMGEDAACVYKCLLEANSIYILDKAFYHYRQIESSMTNSYDDKRFEKYDKVIKYLYKTLPINKYEIGYQIECYKAFLVKHAVNNQSRAPISVFKRGKLLKKLLKNYGLDSVYKDINIKNISFLNRLFINLFNHHKYNLLLIMCYINSSLKKKEKS